MKAIQKLDFSHIVWGGVFAIAVLLLCAACSNLFSKDDDEKSSILLQLPGSSRSAQSETVRYTVTFRHAAGAEWTVQGVPGGFITSGEIPAGIYSATAIAYNAAGVAVGSGTAGNIVVQNGQTAYATLTMSEITYASAEDDSTSQERFMAQVAATPAGGTLVLTENVTITKDISIDKNITIDGQGKYGFVAGMSNTPNDYTIYYPRIELTGVTFKDCNVRYETVVPAGTQLGDGTVLQQDTTAICEIGVFVIRYAAGVHIKRCTFLDSMGLYIGIAKSPIIIEDCTFQNSKPLPQDSEYFMSIAMGFISRIASTEDMTQMKNMVNANAITSGDFLNFYNNTPITISGCSFTGGISRYNGSAIAINGAGNTTITGCTFTNNKCEDTYSSGSVINISYDATGTTTITNNTFRSNSGQQPVVYYAESGTLNWGGNTSDTSVQDSDTIMHPDTVTVNGTFN